MIWLRTFFFIMSQVKLNKYVQSCHNFSIYISWPPLVSSPLWRSLLNGCHVNDYEKVWHLFDSVSLILYVLEPLYTTHVTTFSCSRTRQKVIKVMELSKLFFFIKTDCFNIVIVMTHWTRNPYLWYTVSVLVFNSLFVNSVCFLINN